MKPAQINQILQEIFPDASVQKPTETTWQIDTPQFRLLVLSEGEWLRLLIPIASSRDAQPYITQLLEANFDDTKLVRYALHQNVLWGVFHHRTKTLTPEDFRLAVNSLLSLHQQGLSSLFSQLIDKKLKQIVAAAKAQGQSLEATLQTIERFYQEGLLGGIDQESDEREQFIAAWQSRLKQMWQEDDTN
ncbi:MAG: hypothetical protein D6756_01695 [Cyanobacteria bacterium J083]|nr:MAG: hypothetical protein D6756_01695 [Cyanobacteria bacterium J083]